MTEFRDLKNMNDNDREDEAQYFCRFTFGQFFTILVLEVITLAFVFYLGARYGTSYLKIAEEEKPSVTEIVAGIGTGQSAGPLQDAELQAMAKDVIAGGSTADLKSRVKDLLEKQNTPSTAQTPTARQEIVQPQTSQENTQQPVAESAVQPTLAQPTAVQSTTENAAQAPADSGVIRMKSPAGSKFSIQVGSYPNMEEASSKVEDWRGKGYPSFIMIADIPDRGRWYRVRIGGFGSKDDAQVYLDKFKVNEGIDGIVVLNEQ